jgi:hypothetical protein
MISELLYVIILIKNQTVHLSFFFIIIFLTFFFFFDKNLFDLFEQLTPFPSNASKKIM